LEKILLRESLINQIRREQRRLANSIRDIMSGEPATRSRGMPYPRDLAHYPRDSSVGIGPNHIRMAITHITVRGARQHNLRNVSVSIPRNTLTVVTGLSGSGKSSLAFDTIYAEGQRRYVETLSAYARQFLDQM